MIDVAWEHAAGDSSIPKRLTFFVCLDVDGVVGVIAAESNVFLPPCRESDGDFTNHA